MSEGLDGLRAGMAREHLAAGRILRTTTAGWSMWPAIFPGRVVTIEPCDPASVRPGDVVLAATGSELVLHRVLRIRADAAWLAGDASLRADGWVPRDRLLGRIRRRPWDGPLARLSPVLGRPLALGAAAWRRFFDRSERRF